MGYGRHELRYAEPFANSLVADAAFRSWVLQKTEFADHCENARILDKEMFSKRGKKTKYWWRSHYTEVCRCAGCSGQETDLLAIFEAEMGVRFALHIEVKHPSDRFGKLHQAVAYPVRAKCWAAKAPKSVLPHDKATTILLCSELKLKEYAPHLQSFGAVIKFEDIAKNFPNATAL